jgi:phosphotransferase system enzyme I (PtsI)
MQILPAAILRSGLFIGTTRLVRTRDFTVQRTLIPAREADKETELLQYSFAKAKQDLGDSLRDLDVNPADREILQTHLLILDDPELLRLLEDSIRSQSLSAPQAVLSSFDSVISGFREMDNPYFAQRADDYKDVQRKLLGILLGDAGPEQETWLPGQIAVLKEISPSQIATFARLGVKACVCETGSYTSHAAILARALGITTLGSLAGITDQVRDGEVLILDAIDGSLLLSPDPGTLEKYEELLEKYEQKQAALQTDGRQKAETLSGRGIKLRCNLDLPEEIEAISALDAEGIGLFRTEFIYLGRSGLPDEALQFRSYSMIAERSAPHSVTIRTFDLGGDKLSHLIPSAEEDNPNLGCRGIRFSLAHPDIFRTQIRAILRAAATGRIKIMFPMVTDLADFVKAKGIVEQCRAELAAEGNVSPANLPLGVMIEVPSAALGADELARNCDFFSIGTNDLVQYTLAADRNNASLCEHYIQHHPAVLALIAKTVRAARKHSIPVSVCGEMASQPEYIPLLIGMGIDELSVNPAAYYQAKAIIRRCDQALDDLVSGFDFECSLAEVEDLVFNRLKPYYQS